MVYIIPTPRICIFISGISTAVLFKSGVLQRLFSRAADKRAVAEERRIKKFTLDTRNCGVEKHKGPLPYYFNSGPTFPRKRKGKAVKHTKA